MAKKKVNAPVELDLTELAGDTGLTLLRDSDYAMVFDRLPLFLPRIDKVFGGGLPFGRMVEIAGKPSGGKCLTKDSNILTAEGYKTVEEIINEQGLVASCTSKQVPAEIELINRFGQVEKTSHIHFNNKQKVYNVVTRTGLSQKITGNHPLLVADKTGAHIWKTALELEVGDFVVTRRGDYVSGNIKLDPEYAYVLGALIADGHFGEKRLSFTNDDPDVLNRVEQYLTTRFSKVHRYAKGNSIELHVNSKELLTEFYREIDVSPVNAKDKKVPNAVLRADLVSQTAFLRGFVDCEGYFTEDRVEISSASKRLLTQIQLMLKNINIIGFLRQKVVKEYEENYYGVLTLYGKDAVSYINTVSTYSQNRREQAKLLLSKKEEELTKSNHDYVPYSEDLVRALYKSVDISDRSSEYAGMIRKGRNVSRENIDRIINELQGDPFLQHHLMYINDENFYYDEIKRIEYVGEEPTFDFTLPLTHSFIAESIINHNSTLSYHAARVATALGCIVVLIDVEGTADRVRLSQLGIDVSKVLVKQPDPEKVDKKGNLEVQLTVEEVGRTIEHTINIFHQNYPNVRVIYIWDSVGQTPSEDEIGKDFGERNVGARAKAITQFVTKIAPLISETKSLLIGINQVRDSIGGNPMFPTYSVPGGNAWEHYASLRLEIQKKTAIKQGDEKIGHVMGVHVRKSKVSRPFQIANGFLISDNGMDYEYNLAEMAKEEGIIKQAGASLSFVDRFGTEHKKRKADFIEWLRTPEAQPVRQEILNRLVLVSYPDGKYPALENKTLNIEGWIDKIEPWLYLDTASTDTGTTSSEDVEDTDALVSNLMTEINNED